MTNESRRAFIKDGSKAALAVTVSAIPYQEAKSETKNMFIHHVYFWLKPGTTEEEKNKLLEGVKSLTKIKTIKLSHVGTPASTNRPVIDRSYSISLLLIFDNIEDQNKYQDDPIHLKFVEECKAFWEKVIVYDSVNV